MEDLLNLLRVQRHDFMNHLQVIFGYMQLDKTDQAKEYIGQVSLELQKTGKIFKIGDSELVLQLLLAVQKGFNNQVNFVVDVEQNLGIVKIEKATKESVLRIINNIIELAKPVDFGENITINLDIDVEDEEFLFNLLIPNTNKNLNEGLMKVLESSREDLDSRGTKTVINRLEDYNEVVFKIPKVI